MVERDYVNMFMSAGRKDIFLLASIVEFYNLGAQMEKCPVTLCVYDLGQPGGSVSLL